MLVWALQWCHLLWRWVETDWDDSLRFQKSYEDEKYLHWGTEGGMVTASNWLYSPLTVFNTLLILLNILNKKLEFCLGANHNENISVSQEQPKCAQLVNQHTVAEQVYMVELSVRKMLLGIWTGCSVLPRKELHGRYQKDHFILLAKHLNLIHNSVLNTQREDSKPGLLSSNSETLKKLWLRPLKGDRDQREET